MPYNCLRGAYNKPRLVQGISKAPLRHPRGPAKALGHEHKQNGPSLFPFFFSSLLSLFLLSFCTVLHVFVARLALLHTSGAVFGNRVSSLLSLDFHSLDSLLLYERNPKNHRPDRDTGLDSEWHHEYHI